MKSLHDFLPVSVPDATIGEFKVETFEMSDAESYSTMLRSVVTGDKDIFAPAGIYKKLVQMTQSRGEVIVMSNTPMEFRTNEEFVKKAKGRVLINGLGLGLVLDLILQKASVKEVIVVEYSQDVIDLVAPTFSDDPRLTIVRGDAFTYKPPANTTFDVVWHDIWSFIETDNLREMDQLEEKYSSIARWQGSWCRNECRGMKKKFQQLMKSLPT